LQKSIFKESSQLSRPEEKAYSLGLKKVSTGTVATGSSAANYPFTSFPIKGCLGVSSISFILLT
jgi:hypothetical protein